MPTSPESETDRTQPADDAEPKAPDQNAAPGDEFGALKGQLAAAEDRYRRALADLDNYRKRMERELERRVSEAGTAVTHDWLEALDSVERALRMAPEDQGLLAVLHQMENILTRRGIARITGVGERFDPQQHEAVAAVPTAEAPDQTVVDVARSGFVAQDGSVVRPAQVVVATNRASSS